MREMVTTQGAIRSAEKMLDFIEENQPYADLIKEGESAALAQLRPETKRNILRAADVVKLWRRRGRQTLAMHPGMVSELALAGSDRIPTSVLNALPYINPMVVYADPPVFGNWELMTGRKSSTPERLGVGKAMRLLGFFTHGTKYGFEELEAGGDAEVFFGDTNAPELQGAGKGNFGVLALFEVLDDFGNVIDMECNTLSVPFGVVGTLKELVVDLSHRFYFDASATADAMPGGALTWLNDVMSHIVGTLFYLCSTTLEAEKVPASATEHFRKTFARKPLSLYRIGWTTGAAITAYRQSRSRWKPSEQSDPSHQQDPQHRRAHIKVVWTGKGRSIPRTVLVTAYWTHKELLGESGVNVVHRVPPDRDHPPGESLDTALGLRPEQQ